jgi:hypothetical protein
MQSIGRSPSPPEPIVLTRPADMTFEDGKAPDTDQTTSRLIYIVLKNIFFIKKYFSQKDVNSELSATNTNIREGTLNPITNTNISESKSCLFIYLFI